MDRKETVSIVFVHILSGRSHLQNHLLGKPAICSRHIFSHPFLFTWRPPFTPEIHYSTHCLKRGRSIPVGDFADQNACLFAFLYPTRERIQRWNFRVERDVPLKGLQYDGRNCLYGATLPQRGLGPEEGCWIVDARSVKSKI
jgi:hypothetical protein